MSGERSLQENSSGMVMPKVRVEFTLCYIMQSQRCLLVAV